MSKASKKKIETTGKIEETVGQKPTTAPTRLEQIWGGFNELSRYGTLSEEEYDAKLSTMNRTDMEAHARQLGVVIVESSSRLKDNLKKEFRIYISTLNRPLQLGTSAVNTKQLNLTPEVKRILAEGK